MICEYNKDDPARLAKELLKSADIYVGMRGRAELDECNRLDIFDLIIWVDASDRIEANEDMTSNELGRNDADMIIYNNGSLEELHNNYGIRYLARYF